MNKILNKIFLLYNKNNKNGERLTTSRWRGAVLLITPGEASRKNFNCSLNTPNSNSATNQMLESHLPEDLW